MHFEKGFSDDDSGSGDELFHHVFKSNARAKSINPGMRQRKSPRRSDDDDLENILRTKKHKSSNLGGPVGFDDRANSEVTTTAEHQGHISIFGGTTHQTDEIHNTEQSGALNQIIPQPPPSPEPSQGDENQPPAASKVSPCFDLSLSDALSDYQGSPVPPSEHSYQMPDELRKDIEQVGCLFSPTNNLEAYDIIAKYYRIPTSSAQV
jgi:hypothetical protein